MHLQFYNGDHLKFYVIQNLDFYWEFVADSVIQATGRVEFEDGLRLEEGSPPWRLKGSLEQPHLA